MRLVFGLVLVLGLGLAGFAVHMAQGYIAQYEAALVQERQAREAQVPLTEIYVAKRALRFGEQIAQEDVQLVKFPQASMPPGAFQTEAALFPDGARALRSATRAIEPFEPILAVKVTAPGAEASLSTSLARGMRAFAIKVDVASGVSGFLSPGDRVDVYWSSNAGLDGGGLTKLIEANMKIIAIDQTADQERMDPTIARTVTVEATPPQVAALAQAQTTGRLSLSLVGASDDTISENIQVDQRGLLGIQEQVRVEVAPERVCTVRTRRGGETVEDPIACTN